MKKLVVLLSLFTSISLANPFEDVSMGKLEPIIHEDAIIFLIISLVLFLSSIVYTMKNYKIVLGNDNIEAKKKVKRSLIFLVISFVFLTTGSEVLRIAHIGFDGLPEEFWSDELIAFNNKKGMLYTQFDYLYYVILSSVVILAGLLELARRKKIGNAKVVYIISAISSVMATILTVVLMFGIVNLHK